MTCPDLEPSNAVLFTFQNAHFPRHYISNCVLSSSVFEAEAILRACFVEFIRVCPIKVTSFSSIKSYPALCHNSRLDTNINEQLRQALSKILTAHAMSHVICEWGLKISTHLKYATSVCLFTRLYDFYSSRQLTFCLLYTSPSPRD